MLRYFAFSAVITIAAVVTALLAQGVGAMVTIIVLIAIEIAFSFDNAVINAKVLARLSRLWQQLFLTVGMVFAILGMRFVFPILIVMVTTGLPWGTVIDTALNDPHKYAHYLEAAHISIAAFGGSFLLLLTLYFLFDGGEREILWLQRLERPLQRAGGSVWIPPLLAALIVVILSLFAGDDAAEVLRAGLAGVAVYAAIKLIIDGLGKLAPAAQKTYTGWPAFLAFLYLQLLDASFSFDGVLGAFAITDKVLLIALGLGVGAFWVRSLTVFMVRHGTLDVYRYLEHGAHYAILVLAAALLGSIFYPVPDAVTGVVGLGIIASSFIASRQALRASHNKAI
ncbi:MAG TPA: DUF475 domain-containing protein [Candidatus Saccharimonadales bacterium]|nr:DUF475 domain-containing protein [Candidatus Saccharimonadales bacterium]